MKKIFFAALFLVTVSLHTNAQCIIGNPCLSAESGEQVFQIYLPDCVKEKIDSTLWRVGGNIKVVSSTQESISIRVKNPQCAIVGGIYFYAYITHNVGGVCSFSFPVKLASKYVHTCIATPPPPTENTCSAEVIPHIVPVYGSNLFYSVKCSNQDF